MKRLIPCGILAALAGLIGCSEKLGMPTSPGNETVYDSTIIVDTVIINDTTTVIDTVYVDTSATDPLCGTLRAPVKRLDWFVPLDTGQYTLYFSGSTDSDQPPQTLTVQIGEAEYPWPVANQKELAIQVSDRSPGVWVSITAQPPPARGHAIRICLQVQIE